MKSLINILEVIIWPGTLLLVIFWFRKQLQTVFSRLNNIDASATGVSMSFSDAVAAAKRKALNLAGENISKSTTSIKPSMVSEIGSMKKSILQDLRKIATNNNIKTEGQDLKSLNDKLTSGGMIIHEKSALIKAFIDIDKLAHKDINSQELEDVKLIFKTIQKL